MCVELKVLRTVIAFVFSPQQETSAVILIALMARFNEKV